MALGELGQLGILGDELVQAALHVETICDATLQELAPCLRKSPSLRRDTDHGDRWLEGEGILDGSHDGDAFVRLSRTGRVENRDDRVRAVANDPAHCLPVVRVV